MMKSATALAAPLARNGPMRLYPARVVEIKEEAYAIMTYSLVFEDEGHDVLKFPNPPSLMGLP